MLPWWRASPVFRVSPGDRRESKGFFRFTAKTSWKGGAVTEITARGRSITADEPEGLGGTDSAADPVELLLAALTSCVSIGEIEVGGDLDLRGYAA